MDAKLHVESEVNYLTVSKKPSPVRENSDSSHVLAKTKRMQPVTHTDPAVARPLTALGH